LYDPEGINREELSRLAKARVMIDKFDKSKLSPKGFKVLVNDAAPITLPNGEVVENTLNFRNEFHLHPLATADLFVPCGGRPESINLSNVHKVLHKDGKPKFKIIVEGANLFITQDARMVLEQAGAVLYKDASANKGGVTSSSLEVLAALSLDDQTFATHMAVQNGVFPEFYKNYVVEVQNRIEADATLEFECIWKEHERTGIPRFLLTDQVSAKINQLNQFVAKSNLWDHESLRMVILSHAIPKTLQNLVGLDTILKNAPENYIKAIFSAYLASRYVYKHGIQANEFAFFDFMQPYVATSLTSKVK
jgi:glutamate dehydrogenase